MIKYLRILAIILGLPALALAQSQMIPPGPYGSSGGSSSGGGGATPGGPTNAIQLNGGSSTFSGFADFSWNNSQQFGQLGPMLLGAGTATGLGDTGFVLYPTAVSTATAANYTLFAVSSGETILNSSSGEPVQIRTGNSIIADFLGSNMSVNCGGNVGTFNFEVCANLAADFEKDNNATTEIKIVNEGTGTSDANVVALVDIAQDTAESWFMIRGSSNTAGPGQYAANRTLVEARNYDLALSAYNAFPIRIFNNGQETAVFSANNKVGIGTDTPASSAILDISSTTKGVRFTPMTTTQKNAISSPADGLMVYDTTLESYQSYNGTSAAWQSLVAPGGTGGDVQFANGGFSGDNALYWDEVDKRLSINMSGSANYALEVNGNAGTSWGQIVTHGNNFAANARFGDLIFEDNATDQPASISALQDGSSNPYLQFVADGRVISGTPTSYVLFLTSTGSTLSSTMKITKGSSFIMPTSFGIGNSSPSDMLDVNGNVAITGTTALGTTVGSGTQMYRCSGGSDAGWLLYGNSGAAQTLCTGGGGSLVATGVYLP